MNVLLTTDAFPPGAGGSGRSTATLARALAGRGHQVRVAVARHETKGQTSYDGIAVSEIAIPEARIGSRERERAYAEGLVAAVGEEAWDLVHAQHWLSALATARACPRLPLVVTVRDYWPVCIWSTRLSGDHACPGCSYTRRVVCVGRRYSWLWPVAPALSPFVGAELRRRRDVLARAKAVVAVSRYVRETLPFAGAQVIPNFLGKPEELDRPADAPERYLLFVGKLEPNKAPDRLVPILEAAGTATDGIPLLIAGTGRLLPELERQANASGREVRFLGWVDENRVPAWMHYAEAVLFPSRWQEPLSRVLVEGLGVGAVLIVEPTGGSADIVADGESGLLGASIEELGGALARVLSEPGLAERLRRGARARAEARFSEAVVIPKVESLYQQVRSLA